MSTLKKRQHYVWRYYLRNWSNNENIWTWFIKLNKIEKPGLMGVAQEKYFYKLIDFEEEEEKFLKNYLEKTTPKDLKGLVFDFFNMFIITSKLKKQIEQSNHNDNKLIAEEIKKLEVNMMEDAHGIIENLGTKLVKCKNLSDLKSLDALDYDLFSAIMFICFQYFRTKKRKDAVLKSFEENEIFQNLAKKCWNIISYQMSTILAKSIFLDKNLRFVFIENSTELAFITGDQPVFNILNEELDDGGNAKHLELYYPLSPKKAIRIYFDKNQTEKFTENQVDIKQIKFLNKKVVENSLFYVFADNRELLEQIKK